MSLGRGGGGGERLHSLSKGSAMVPNFLSISTREELLLFSLEELAILDLIQSDIPMQFEGSRFLVFLTGEDGCFACLLP